MLYFFAILAISALSLCCWAILMARNPKDWRLWWMTRMGIPDLNNSRDQKRQQEFRLMVVSYCLFFVMLATMTFSIWKVFEEIHDFRNKTPFEQTRDQAQKEMEKYKGRFNKLK